MNFHIQHMERKGRPFFYGPGEGGRDRS